MPKFTPDNAADMGRKGGLKTFEKYGRDHMCKIGKLGLQATVDKHYNGDRRLAINTLIHRGLMAIDPMPYNGAWTTDRISDRLKD